MGISCDYAAKHHRKRRLPRLLRSLAMTGVVVFRLRLSIDLLDSSFVNRRLQRPREALGREQAPALRYISWQAEHPLSIG